METKYKLGDAVRIKCRLYGGSVEKDAIVVGYKGTQEYVVRTDRGDLTIRDSDIIRSPEKDPHGIPQNSPGAKNDAGKPLASLLLGFSRALEGVVAVSTYGAAKYTRNGWESVPDGEQRYRDAAWRHILKSGQEELDPESGLSHIWHATWNLLAAEELRQRSLKPEPAPNPTGLLGGWKEMDSAPTNGKTVWGWCIFPAGEEARKVVYHEGVWPLEDGWNNPVKRLPQNVKYWTDVITPESGPHGQPVRNYW